MRHVVTSLLRTAAAVDGRRRRVGHPVYGAGERRRGRVPRRAICGSVRRTTSSATWPKASCARASCGGKIGTDNSDWTIDTSPPTPGGFVEIAYQALGKLAGVYVIPARMTSDQTAGTTTERVTLTVTP